MAAEIVCNGVCPVCRAGACDLERRAIAAKAGVTFVDVAAHPEPIAALNIPLDTVRLKLHAVDGDGRVRVGMPALAQAWPRRRLIAPLGGWCVSRHSLGSAPGSTTSPRTCSMLGTGRAGAG